MSTHHCETKLTDEGKLTLNDLPFHAGETAEVIVVSHSPKVQPADPYPLRGTPIHYAEPTESVVEEDWEALR